MSGHNKWSKIKREKAVTDSKKSKIFSKYSRAITIAAKQGGGDVASNPTLRLAVEKAKAERMPKDNIQKAIDKGIGKTGDSEYHEVIYEGYGPEGVAFMVKGLTDNKNRTVAEIRNIFNKHGGSLGGSGSTAYIFSPDPENPSFEIEVEAENVAVKLSTLCELLEDNDDVQEVYTNFNVSDELAGKL